MVSGQAGYQMGSGAPRKTLPAAPKSLVAGGGTNLEDQIHELATMARKTGETTEDLKTAAAAIKEETTSLKCGINNALSGLHGALHMTLREKATMKAELTAALTKIAEIEMALANVTAQRDAFQAYSHQAWQALQAMQQQVVAATEKIAEVVATSTEQVHAAKEEVGQWIDQMGTMQQANAQNMAFMLGKLKVGGLHVSLKRLGTGTFSARRCSSCCCPDRLGTTV